MRRSNITIRQGGSQEQQLVNGRGRLLFVSWKEVTGSAASEGILYDGQSIGGQQCFDAIVPTSTTLNLAVGTHGIAYVAGLFLHLAVGALAGTVAIQSEFSDAEWEALEAAGLVP